MKRIGGLTLALSIGLALVPLAAQAQAPRDNAFTREAEKQLTLVLTKSDPAAKATLYQSALDAALEGLRENPGHAKLWWLAGDAYVGVGQFPEGLEAYRKAVEIYPEYDAELAEKREAGWIAAYNAGVEHLQANEFPEAAEDLTSAHAFFKGRPEAMAYLGAVHAQLGHIAESETYYRETLAFLDGPMAAEATPEEKADWEQFRQMANTTLAQLEGAGAVQAYQNGDYDTAIAGFQKLVAMNPQDRDLRFMVFTALYEKVRGMAQETAELEPAEQATQLDPVFAEIVTVGSELEKVDPANSAILQILAGVRSARAKYQDTPEAQKKLQDEALAILERRQAMPFYVDEVAVEQSSETSAQVQGGIIGNQAQVGTPVKIRMILVGQGGATVGSQEIEVTAPAPGEGVGFQETVTVTGPVLGWRYEIVN